MEDIRAKQLQRIALLIEQNQYKYAQSILMDLLKDSPQDHEALYCLAKIEYELGNVDKAASIARDILAINANSAEAYFLLSIYYFYDANKTDIAEEYAYQALELTPMDSEVFDHLALICYDKEDYNMCYRHAKKALQLDPKNADAYIAMAMYYTSKDDMENVLYYIKKALELEPTSYKILALFSKIHMVLANHKEGFEIVKDAIRLNPNDKQVQLLFKEAFILNNPLFLPWYYLKKFYFILIDQFKTPKNAVRIIFILLLCFGGCVKTTFNTSYSFEIMIGFVALIFLYRIVLWYIVGFYYQWLIHTGKLAKYL